MAFQYGEGRHGFAVAETTYGTQVKPVAGDAFRLTSFDITPARERPEVPEALSTRSLQATVEGRKSCTWRASLVCRPSGTAGTAPDYGLLWKHALGTETIVGGTSVKYVPLRDPSGLSLSLYDRLDDVMQGVIGAVVSQVAVTFGGDNFVTLEFSGEAKDMLMAGTNQADGAGTSATALIVDDSYHYMVGGIIKIAASDNAGAGFQITAINHTTRTLTITPAATWVDNDAVVPFTPTPTVAGTALHGTVGSLSLNGGSSTITHIGGTCNIDTGITLYNRGYGSNSATAVQLSGPRRARGSLNFVLEDTLANGVMRLGRAYNKVAEDFNLTVGDTAGAKMLIDIPVCEVNPFALGGAGAGLVEFSMPFVARTSTATAAEDEIEIMHN